MDTGKKTIFLVDDHIANLKIGINTLSGHYNVTTMNSGGRLLKMLEKNDPDLILLDVDMPEMSGHETIRQIKSNEKTKNVPVIFLATQSDGDYELEGLSLGAVDYIPKPFSPPLLLKRVEMHFLLESQKREILSQKQEILAQTQEILTRTQEILAHKQELLAQKQELAVKSEQLENLSANAQGSEYEKGEVYAELQIAVIKALAELVEYRDEATVSHVEATQAYMKILMDALAKSGIYQDEVSTWDMDLILQSAQLHDVGRVAIEDYILRKPGKLSKKEYAKIKTHTTFGETVIENIKKNTTNHAFLEQARLMATTHHEKWNGTGYPNRLRGTKIPLQGRLMAIADVYDALVSVRPYKIAFSHEEAVDIIRKQSGAHFDPKLVGLFLEVADEFRAASESINTLEKGEELPIEAQGKE